MPPQAEAYKRYLKKFDQQETANAQLTFTFLSPTGLSTDPLYYVASNAPGLF